MKLIFELGTEGRGLSLMPACSAKLTSTGKKQLRKQKKVS